MFSSFGRLEGLDLESLLSADVSFFSIVDFSVGPSESAIRDLGSLSVSDMA